MKPLFLCLLLLLSWQGTVHAQDKILTRNGDMLAGKVLQVDSIKIHYQALADSTFADTVTLLADTQTINIADVFMIKFRNGTKTVFNEIEYAPPAAEKKTGKKDKDAYGANYSPYQLNEMGAQDAKENFRASGVFVGAMASGFIGGIGIVAFPLNLVTAVPPAIAAVSPPKQHNLVSSNPEAMQNHHYYTGYMRKAESRKKGNAVAGYLSGSALGIITLIGGLGFLLFW